MRSSTSSSDRYLRVYAAAICLWLAFLAITTEWLVRSRVEPNDILMLHLQLYRRSEAVNAAFGDSQLAHAFIGSRDFVNLAGPSENVDTILKKVRLYFRDKEPGRVLLQANPQMFARYRRRDQTEYARYFEDGNDRLTPRILHPYHRGKLRDYWAVFFEKGVFQSGYKFHPSGWLERPGEWEKEPRATRVYRATGRAKRHEPAVGFHEHAFADLYVEMIEFLTRRRAEVCLVTLPVSQEYVAAAAEKPRFAEALRWFERVAGEVGVRYVNYFSRFAGELALFGDQDHLDPGGSRLLTKQLLRDCFGIEASAPL